MAGLFSRDKEHPAKTRHAVSLLEPGIHHYLRESQDGKKRIHLRIDADGSGTLLVNASRMYHFNPSASLMAHALLEGSPDEKIISALRQTFNVKPAQVAADFAEFKDKFALIAFPEDDPCPICDLEVDTLTPFTSRPSAPYRMDLALTYRCNNRCLHCYNEASRAREELTTDQWKQVLDRVWALGIPHVVFTGGEPTLRDDLPELVAYAEQLGLITGLNTNGRRLAEQAFLERLVSAGLDHVQITLESHDAAIHDRITAAKNAWVQTVSGIRNALASKMFVMTNTTLLKSNSTQLKETLEFLSRLGVPTVGLNGLIYSGRGALTDEEIAELELHALLEVAKTHMEHSGQRLIWYTPTLYCHFNPVESGLGVKGCTAALYNMCIEPDGGVLPCQSYYQPLGNFLHDEWDSIWNHDLAVSIRERHYAAEGCRYCDLLDTCGGGCPLYLESNRAVQPEPVNALPF
jgi:radical SAM protein with 4Fe4S-binding SPASM domain